MEINLDHLSKPRQEFVKLAESDGYNVSQCGNNEIFILRGKTIKSKGVLIFEDGSIFRSGLDLNLAKPMSLKDAKAFLEL
jgi:hypothetical protein